MLYEVITHGFGLIEETPNAVLARVRAAASLEVALQGAQYVQENVRETLEAKKAIFAEMVV